jgi:serine/threonine protein kinase
MNECPSADDLSVYLEGDASSALAQRILAHLDQCAACRQLISSSFQTTGPKPASGFYAGRVQTFREKELIDERYRIVRFISRGGMGEVYEAWDTQLHEAVALKTIVCTGLDNQKLLTQLRTEIQIARRIMHPNVCRVLEFGLHDRVNHGSRERTPYFTMELLVGETLGQRRNARLPLPEAQVLPLLLQIVDGLIAVHAAGIVHRDLKPDNIFIIRSESGAERAVVVDFGLARSMNRPSSLVSSNLGAAVGTPAYMAPEQAAGGAPCAAWDIYAFGAMVFELLSGRLPFSGESPLAIALAKTNTAAPLLASVNGRVTPRMSKIVARCLERFPARRYGTMLELRDALQDANRRSVVARPHNAVNLSRMFVIAATGLLALGFCAIRQVGARTAVAPTVPSTQHIQADVRAPTNNQVFSVRTEARSSKTALADRDETHRPTTRPESTSTRSRKSGAVASPKRISPPNDTARQLVQDNTPTGFIDADDALAIPKFVTRHSAARTFQE